MTSLPHLSSTQCFAITSLSFTPASSSFCFISGGAFIVSMRFLLVAIMLSTPLATASPHCAEPPLLPQANMDRTQEMTSNVFMDWTLPPTRCFGALQDRICAGLADRAELALGVHGELAPALRHIGVHRAQRIARV